MSSERYVEEKARYLAKRLREEIYQSAEDESIDSDWFFELVLDNLIKEDE